MSKQFTLNVQARTDKGKGASRRLRHANMVPGVIYGGGQEPQSVMMVHHELTNQLKNEAFYSHILDVVVDGESEQVILKDLQRHPYKAIVMHFDLLRVVAGETLRVNVPLHFTGQENSPGVKLQGGRAAHTITEVEINCLPTDLPEYIEVDVSACEVGSIIHLSDIQLPEGAELAAFVGMDEGERAEHDLAIFSVSAPKLASDDEDEDDADAADSADSDAEAEADA